MEDNKSNGIKDSEKSIDSGLEAKGADVEKVADVSEKDQSISLSDQFDNLLNSLNIQSRTQKQSNDSESKPNETELKPIDFEDDGISQIFRESPVDSNGEEKSKFEEEIAEVFPESSLVDVQNTEIEDDLFQNDTIETHHVPDEIMKNDFEKLDNNTNDEDTLDDTQMEAPYWEEYAGEEGDINSKLTDEYNGNNSVDGVNISVESGLDIDSSSREDSFDSESKDILYNDSYDTSGDVNTDLDNPLEGDLLSDSEEFSESDAMESLFADVEKDSSSLERANYSNDEAFKDNSLDEESDISVFLKKEDDFLNSLFGREAEDKRIENEDALDSSTDIGFDSSVPEQVGKEDVLEEESFDDLFKSSDDIRRDILTTKSSEYAEERKDSDDDFDLDKLLADDEDDFIKTLYSDSDAKSETYSSTDNASDEDIEHSLSHAEPSEFLDEKESDSSDEDSDRFIQSLLSNETREKPSSQEFDVDKSVDEKYNYTYSLNHSEKLFEDDRSVHSPVVKTKEDTWGEENDRRKNSGGRRKDDLPFITSPDFDELEEEHRESVTPASTKFDFESLLDKKSLMTVEDIYKKKNLSDVVKETVFMIEVYEGTLPENLPVEVKRESVLNILEASQLDLKSLVGDAFNRIDILNNVLEDLSNKNDELNRATLDKISDLERQIYELKVEMQRRGEYKETQNTSISYEIQRIVNIVEFIDPE